MDFTNRFEEIKALVEELTVDAAKTYGKKNKSAGKRVRKGLLQLKKLATECRKETLEICK